MRYILLNVNIHKCSISRYMYRGKNIKRIVNKVSKENKPED